MKWFSENSQTFVYFLDHGPILETQSIVNSIIINSQIYRNNPFNKVMNNVYQYY